MPTLDKNSDIPINVNFNLIERNFGIWEDLSFKQIEEFDPARYKEWQDNYIEYTSDIWVGSLATVNITSGNIGNMFVNGNKYGNGLATVNGGTIENVYLEYSADHGSTLNYVGGTINNIYISTTTEGVSNKTENPVIGTYTNVE